MTRLLNIFFLILLSYSLKINAQQQAPDSTYYSYALRSFYYKYDTVLVYRKTCALLDIGESIILVKNHNRWKSFKGIELYAYDEQLGYSTFKKLKLKKYRVAQPLLAEVIKELINQGLQTLNEDSLKLCESELILDENGYGSQITIMTLDGCGYRFEFMTKDSITLKRAPGNIRACHELTNSNDQEVFIRCQKLIHDKLHFKFEN
jgi:hypothetical protein